ncbi:hypothetical protein QR680_013832 [Steinernema hermaphroditum]|uniref:Uncharacterized protein n=1 Tax=Steinernema hermaphroditum TaxID=289476 RepID=A0AA39I885_9BILA|nr:hypothetical protein QR680_013832 [Steinernema hermaphroditum]
MEASLYDEHYVSIRLFTLCENVSKALLRNLPAVIYAVHALVITNLWYFCPAFNIDEYMKLYGLRVAVAFFGIVIVFYGFIMVRDIVTNTMRYGHE